MADRDSLPDGDDYYAILNLPRTATVDDIRHAYRTLGPAVHPDKLSHTLELASVRLPPNYPLASTFHRVQRAAAVLSDPLTRWAWDEHGEEGVKVAEKLRARLAWRTEQSARDYITRAVKANRQRSGADEQMEEEEDDDAKDSRDGSKQTAPRLGAGLQSLQSLSSSTRVVYAAQCLFAVWLSCSSVQSRRQSNLLPPIQQTTRPLHLQPPYPPPSILPPLLPRPHPPPPRLLLPPPLSRSAPVRHSDAQHGGRGDAQGRGWGWECVVDWVAAAVGVVGWLGCRL